VIDPREALNSGLESLRHHALRSFLAMLGIIFGVGAVIAMLSIGAGAERQALEIIDAMGLRNVVTGQLAATTRTTAAGAFTFENLASGNYVVETLNAAGRVMAASASVDVGPGASVTGVAVKKTVSIEPTRLSCTGTRASAAAASSPASSAAPRASSSS